MSLDAPRSLAFHHRLDAFDSGHPLLNEWLVRHARAAQACGSARTFVVAEAGQVVAYHSLAVGQIDTAEVPERVRKGMGQYPIPVVLLARLAVDKAYQGQGVGVGLLQDAIRRTLLIADQAGVRALMTHPIDDSATRFYQRFGFVCSPTGANHWLLLLKDARKLLESK